jgi:hypothetical protein
LDRAKLCLFELGCLSSKASILGKVDFTSEKRMPSAFSIYDMAVTPIPNTTASFASSIYRYLSADSDPKIMGVPRLAARSSRLVPSY